MKNKSNNNNFPDSQINKEGDYSQNNNYNKLKNKSLINKDYDYKNNIESKDELNRKFNNNQINLNEKSINNPNHNENKQDDIYSSNIVNMVSKAALGNKYRPPYKKYKNSYN